MKNKKKEWKYNRFMQYKKDGIHDIQYVDVPGFSGYKVYDDRGFTLLSISTREIMKGAHFEKDKKDKKGKDDKDAKI